MRCIAHSLQSIVVDPSRDYTHVRDLFGVVAEPSGSDRRHLVESE